MNKRRYFWSRLSYQWKLLVYTAVILLLAFCLYFFAGSPPLSMEHRYYRAARDHMVGPGRIIAHLELEQMDYTDLIIAEDGEDLILYIVEENEFSPAELACRQKTGDLTVLAAPCFRGGLWSNAYEQHLPVFLFDEYPDAVRAEMEVTLSARYGTEEFSKTYALESRREYAGFFQFDIYVHNSEGLGAEGYALYTFSNLSSNSLSAHMNTAVPVTVRLYDTKDSLLLERSWEVRSVAAEAHARRGE